MKIEVLKENLKAGLDVVGHIAGKNMSLPILNAILLGAENNFLSLTSTNLEAPIRFWCLVKMIKEGKMLLPVKVFSSFISSLPNEKIIMEARGQNIHIECKNFKTQIQGYNPEEFPIIPTFSELGKLELENQKLCQGLSQVIDVPAQSQARPEISGVYFHFSKNTMKMVSTDSFRLAEKSVSLDSPVKKEVSFILPQKPVRDITSILGGKEGQVALSFSSNQAMVSLPMKNAKQTQVEITSRLIEGEYPNYQEIIPGKFKTSAVVKRDEFLNQIKTASLFSGRINEVKVSVNPEKNEMEVFSKSPDVGETKSSMGGKITGESVAVSFNHKFLADGLLNIKSSEVIFEVSKEDGPCILRPLGDASYLYVVMPIKAL